MAELEFKPDVPKFKASFCSLFGLVSAMIFFLSSSAPQLKYAISYITWKWKWFAPGYGKDLARGLGSINKNWKKLSVAKMERKNK